MVYVKLLILFLSTALSNGFRLEVPSSKNSETQFPLWTKQPIHYQQVFSSSLFPDNLIAITGLKFLASSDFSEQSFQLEVSLARAAYSFTPILYDFDKNLGEDKLVVFEGTLVLSYNESSSILTSQNETSHLELNIPLDDVYNYSPSFGHLILDIKNAGTSEFGGSLVSVKNLDSEISSWYKVQNDSSPAMFNSGEGILVVLYYEYQPVIKRGDNGTAIIDDFFFIYGNLFFRHFIFELKKNAYLNVSRCVTLERVTLNITGSDINTKNSVSIVYAECFMVDLLNITFQGSIPCYSFSNITYQFNYNELTVFYEITKTCRGLPVGAVVAITTTAIILFLFLFLLLHVFIKT